MRGLTNKKLLKHKADKVEIYTFDKNGYRAMLYSRYDIITALEVIKKHTLAGQDILLIDYNEKNDMKVTTELEDKILHRRATKNEIIEFYKIKAQEGQKTR